MKPKRVQRKRERGWRAPEGAVYVGRGSKWGNPFVVHPDPEHGYALDGPDDPRRNWGPNRDALLGLAKALYEESILMYDEPSIHEIRDELAGKDLMCWCDESEPCHADVLLEIAAGKEKQ